MSLSPEEIAAISANLAASMKAAAPAPAAAPITFAAPPAMQPAASFGAPHPTGPAMWPAGAMPSAQPTATGVAVKLTVQLADGREAPVDLNFGPEYANPASLQALIAHLVAAGWPVKVYNPRPQFGGGNGWNGGGGGNRFGGNRFGGGGRFS